MFYSPGYRKPRVLCLVYWLSSSYNGRYYLRKMSQLFLTTGRWTAIWLLENMSPRKHDSSKSIFTNFIEKNFSSKSIYFYTCHRIFSNFYTCHRIFLFHKTCHRFFFILSNTSLNKKISYHITLGIVFPIDL